MSPGINDGPRKTGTLPKSNRRNDRNRERSAANQLANRSTYHDPAQHSNNLFQLNWKPTGEREVSRIAKNSNTRSIPSIPSTSYQDISEFASYSSGRQYNFSTEEFAHWHKMVPPTDSGTQSPPRLPSVKPSNVDKMPDRSQVESRLNQIRDYIRVTATIMDSLNQSSDPRAKAQYKKISSMVEDLHDTERKLSALLEQYPSPDESNENADMDENGELTREIQLRKELEDSQRKLAQLQEQQANLSTMQTRVRERLNEARQAQQVLLQQENQTSASLPLPLPTNVEQLESETLVLKGKLAQLQTKKKHMDCLVAELQAVEMSDRGSCSSDGSRNFGRDKAAELEAMKAQLAYLKTLMQEATRARECADSNSDSENEVHMNGDRVDDAEENEEENGANVPFERQSDSDEAGHGKERKIERPTLEEIQAVTRELQEQSALLQSTRAELQRLKQPILASIQANSASGLSNSASSASVAASSTSEKKQSNKPSSETQPTQEKRRQLEDITRNEPSQSSNSNRDVGGPDVNSQRSSSSHVSHTSTPANIWLPPTVAGGSSEQSVDGMMSSDNLLDIGPHTNIVENGINANPNWWPYPPPPMNPLQHGLAEYYRQLLLGSQTQQLQMMGTTMQQCCQLLWAQQRELQSMRSAITMIQTQLRQNQVHQRTNNENNEEYSNLSRSVHHLGDTLDATLPPSSSLPNLVSLPNSSSGLPHSAATTSANSQHQQLNNQVPPGNRANNYWDNFRSYSRQNLLSGNVKTLTDPSSGAIANAVSLTNSAGNAVNSSIGKDKRNREQGADHLPSMNGAEAQYSLNLQLQSNLQQQERENSTLRSNILTNEVSQQQVDNLWDEAHSSYRLPSTGTDEPLQTSNAEMKEVLRSLLTTNKRRPDYLIMILREVKAISEDHRLRPHLLRSLRSLQDSSLSHPLNETTDQTASESCQSSDEDSEVSEVLGVSLEHQSSAIDLAGSSQIGIPSPTARVSLLEHLESPVTFSIDSVNTRPSTSAIKSGYNEDLAEADQSRPESSGNQQIGNSAQDNEQIEEEGASYSASAEATSEFDMDLESAAARTEDEIVLPSLL